jgi:hypothetical protein
MKADVKLFSFFPSSPKHNTYGNKASIFIGYAKNSHLREMKSGDFRK